MNGGPRQRPRGMRLSEMLTLRDQTDADGRLLLEDSAPKKARKRVVQAGVPMKAVPSTHQDTRSRLGATINISAYDALRHDTAEVLDGFAWLARNYQRVNPAARSTLRGLFDTTHLGLTLPLVLFYRAQDPVRFHGDLPTYVASIFKASRGVFSATVDMLNRKGPPSRQVTASEVVAFADAEGHLVRKETQRACAAPTRLIERTIAVILTGDDASPERSELGKLIDFPMLWEFYTVQDGLTQALSDYRYLVDGLTGGNRTLDPTELFGLPVRDGVTTRSFGDVTDSLLRRADAVQAHLNDLLGRSGDLAPVEFPDLAQML